MTGIVVVGGSAGAIEALTSIFMALPRDFELPILVTIHVPPEHPSRLPEIFSRMTSLDVAHATDGEWLRPSTIRVAPPDHHLLVRDGRLRLSRGPRENRHRPSIDALFRSAARWYASDCTGVLLSGGPGDGIFGLAKISDVGGRTIVQDPSDALFPALPERAAETIKPDLVASARDIGISLGTIETDRDSRRASTETWTRSTEVTTMPRELGTANGWKPSGYACPDCSGTLWELDDGGSVHFRCRIGHAFAADSLMEGKREELETSLWSAINVMEERAELSNRLAERARMRGYTETADRYQQTSDEMNKQAQDIRTLLASEPGLTLDGADDEFAPVEPDGEFSGQR